MVMGLDTKGAIIGGLAGGGAGAIIGGSGLFGKKKVPQYDQSFAINLAKGGETQEKGALDQYMTGTQAGQDLFKSEVQKATEAAQTGSQQAAQDYLSQFDPITSRIVQARQDSLKRAAIGMTPELVQAAREAGAASGGLDRGVIQSQLANVPIQQARQFAEGASQLETQALQSQLDARSKVYDATNQMILNRLGIDTKTAEDILNSGNQALINQLNQVIDTSRNSIGLQVQANSAAQGSNIAAAQNQANNQAAILQGLLGLGGTALGAMAGGPAGAAVGGQVGQAAGGAISPTQSTATVIGNQAYPVQPGRLFPTNIPR